MSAEHVELIRRQIEVPLAFVMRFRDGLIVKVEEYLDPEEARRAA